MVEEWQERWAATTPANRQGHEHDDDPPDAKILRIHKGLKKAESAVLIQTRTEKIGLVHFL